MTFMIFLFMQNDFNVRFLQKLISQKSESVSHWYGSANLVLYQNVTDPEHWEKILHFSSARQ
jgi:hypothetical protein